MSAHRVRTSSHAAGELTAFEERLMAEHNQKWTENAKRTDRVDGAALTEAICRLYALAGYEKPRVIVVPSPLVMAFAYGASAALLYRSEIKKGCVTRLLDYLFDRDESVEAVEDTVHCTILDVTQRTVSTASKSAADDKNYSMTSDAVMNDLTYMAVRDAIYNAISETTHRVAFQDMLVTPQAVMELTGADAESATHTVTYQAVSAATLSAVYGQGMDKVTYSSDFSSEAGAATACFDLAGQLGVLCAERWWRVYQGGAYWAGHLSFMTAFRDVLGLDLPEHKALKIYEDCAQAPFRVMHPKFCLVSDFPEILKMDENHQPHCEDGPSHRWRDGWELYHWHGVRVPGAWIKNKDALTPQTALTWENMEQRRAACEILGWHTILQHLEAIIIDTDENPQIGQLLEVNLPDMGREKFLKVMCATGRTFVLPVPSEMTTALQANAWTYGLEGHEYQQLEVRT